jgi:hypothetical protein
LFNVLSGLTSFSDVMPYGQLGSRILGVMLSTFTVQAPCIQDGYAKVNGKTWYDMGKCSGVLISQIFDAMF